MVLLAIGHWVAIELWANSLNYMHGVALKPELWRGEVLVVLSGAALDLMQWRALRSAARKSRLAFWSVAIISVALCASAYGAALRGAAHLTPIILPAAKGSLWSAVIWDMVYFSTWFVLWAAIIGTFEAQDRVRRRDRQLDQAMISAREAQLRALHYQINPHFLLNTLNAVATLIQDDMPKRAEATVLNLADFFRGTLAFEPLRDVRLAEELALQQLYLAIEEVRFCDALIVRFNSPDHLADALVPALILQPLVENAIKHGMRAERPLTLTIGAQSDGAMLTLQVEDDGAGAAATTGGAGVGLENVRQRLAARFGVQGALWAHARPNGGFVVRLQMPMRFAPACTPPRRSWREAVR